MSFRSASFPLLELCRCPWRWGLQAFMLVLLCGCASGPNAHPQDPFEPLNRTIFSFNDAVDRSLVKPVATTYQGVVPFVVRSRVTNFFHNWEDAWSFPNNLLQFKSHAAAQSLIRFGINTVLGLAGLLDVASEFGIERNPEDFGQTLGYWGVPAGPYLVLPLLGPSSLRDGAALIVDAKGNVVTNINDVSTRNILRVLNGVDTRANYISAVKVLEEAALDKYSFTREVHIQQRLNAVYDGNPPDNGMVP